MLVKVLAVGLLVAVFTRMSFASDQIVYFGTGTSQVFYSSLRKDGTLTTPIGIDIQSSTPTWLAVNEKNDILYAVNEENGFLLSFNFSRSSGSLTKINQVSNFGTATCHSQLDSSKRWLGAVNYLTGNYALHSVNLDGSVVENPVFIFQDDVLGGIAHPHQFLFSPDNRFIFVPDLGTDQIMQYEFDALNVSSPIQPNRFQSALTIAKGAGPRHLAFSPVNSSLVFGSNELDSTLNVYILDQELGVLSLVQTLSTVLPTFQGTNYPAEVFASRCGRFVYVSNRGDNSIAKFRVLHRKPTSSAALSSMPDAGTESVIGSERSTAPEVHVVLESIVSCEGDWPRFIGADASETFMFSANQKSNNVAVFKIEPDSGNLTWLFSVPMESPQHVLFIPN